MKNAIAGLTGLVVTGLMTAPACSAPPSNAPGFSLSEAEQAQLAEAIDSGSYGTVTSILILSDGELVYEYYADGITADTLHDTRSVTKTITGMAVGLAVKDGALSVSEEAAPYFADIAPFANPDARKLAITVEDLLTMSSVMECDDWNSFSRGNEERMYVVEDWPSFFWDLPVRGYPAWAQPPEEAKYGRAFAYCTAGVQMLGEITARATGQPFTTYTESRLLTPLGITAFEWQLNGLGQPHMGGGLRLTTRGLGALAELQRLGGEVDGQAILPPSWTEAAITPHAAIPGTDGTEYGYLWWLWPYEAEGQNYRAAMMNGNGGNRVAIFPEFDLTVVLTKTDYNTREMHRQADSFLEQEIVSRLDRASRAGE